MMRSSHEHRPGFTLIEVLIAITILAFLVVVLASLVSGVSRAWTQGEQQVSQFQDGRAILELISRELSQAAISPSLQFVHDPDLNRTPQRGNSDCIFWIGPGPSTASGSLSEIGYYLSDNFELKRFYVPPTDGTNYAVFTAGYQPTDTGALWVTNFIRNSSLVTTVSGGVLGFWARCLDVNGQAIPWLASAPPRFNSAAHFQPAIPSQLDSFKYTSSSTARANLLPNTIELTVITLDPHTFGRNPPLPNLPPDASDSGSPAVTGPNDVPAAIAYYQQKLINWNIKTARTFTTRVRLVNALR
jgi:prepilin-type N-terminal cleavage/methylation domain-containing protein